MNIDKDAAKITTIGYVNWEGRQSIRQIIPQRLFYGTNDYYKTPQWIVEAWDIGRGAMRSFALNNIRHTTDMVSDWAAAAPEPVKLDTGAQLAEELAQAIINNDDKAALVAFVSIVGKLIDTQSESVAAIERIAATLENAKSARDAFYVTHTS